jgi:hypothetical protein
MTTDTTQFSDFKVDTKLFTHIYTTETRINMINSTLRLFSAISMGIGYSMSCAATNSDLSIFYLLFSVAAGTFVPVLSLPVSLSLIGYYGWKMYKIF